MKESSNQKPKSINCPPVQPNAHTNKRKGYNHDSQFCKEKKPKATNNSNSGSVWNFEVDYNDHFETPLIAYEDIMSVLTKIAVSINKSIGDLIIYDPYYCQGQMIQRLQSLGLKSIINQNKDFYRDIKQNNIPEYDILITNPPYSGDHKQKLLSYLGKVNKPYVLLLPAYVATKSYWRDFISSVSSSTPHTTKQSSIVSRNNSTSCTPSLPSTPANNTKSVRYILPPDSYTYDHPEGTGKAIPPFYSCWFLGGVEQTILNTLASSSSSSSKSKRSATIATICSATSSTGGQRLLQVLSTMEELITAGYVTYKRPNPKRRKKMQKSSTK